MWRKLSDLRNQCHQLLLLQGQLLSDYYQQYMQLGVHCRNLSGKYHSNLYVMSYFMLIVPQLDLLHSLHH